MLLYKHSSFSESYNVKKQDLKQLFLWVVFCRFLGPWNGLIIHLRKALFSWGLKLCWSHVRHYSLAWFVLKRGKWWLERSVSMISIPGISLYRRNCSLLLWHIVFMYIWSHDHKRDLPSYENIKSGSAFKVNIVKGTNCIIMNYDASTIALSALKSNQQVCKICT